MWIARNKNNSLWLFNNKPYRNNVSGEWDIRHDENEKYGIDLDVLDVEPSQYSSLKWSDEPIEVRLFTDSFVQSFGDACYKQGENDACAFEYGKEDEGNLILNDYIKNYESN